MLYIMFFRQKWFLSLVSLLFIMISVSSSVLSFAQKTPTAHVVPLSGEHSIQAPKFSKTNVLLAFTQGVSRQQRAVIEQAVQAHEVRSLGIDNVYLVTVPSNQVLNAIHILSKQPGVKYAEPDYTQIVAATPNDPNFPIQWGYHNTGQTVNGTAGTPGADEDVTPAWDVTTGSSSIVIAETDTGVDYTHPDLAPNIWNNPGGIGGCAAGTHGYNTLTATCDPMDDDTVYGGHGTHVAGIMGAAGNNGVGVTGVNWHTTILPVKWVTANGSGATSDLITSLNWILQAKQAGVNIRVVNDSTVFVGTAYSQALSDEIDLLGQNGILFVTAAGNTGDNNDNLSVRRYPCGYDRPTEICVAASDQNDNLPIWANYGSHTVDLAAPGNNVYSTLPHNTYGFINGSSMASPQVAGAAALILSVQDMTPVQLKADILNNVDQIPSMQGLLITGGRLDICKALPGCVPPPTPKLTPTPTPTSVPNSGTFGLTNIGGNSDMMVPDRKRADQATLTVSGNVYKLTMYLAPTGVSGQEVMNGILYADQGGSPGTLLGVTNTFTFASTNTAGWYDLQFPSPIALTPGTYWIGVISGNATHVAGFRWNSVSQIRAVNSNTYANGPSNPFGTATIDSEQMSIYASYTTSTSTPTATPTPKPTATPTPTPTATPTPTPTATPTPTPTATPTPTPTATPTATPTPTPTATPTLIPNTIARWPMDESSGTFVGDATGNGYNGTATTAVGIVAGKFGNARSFNGTQGYIQIANEPTLPFGTSARTVCSWVLTNSLSGTSVIFATGTPSTDQFFGIGRSGSSLVGFGWNDDLSVTNFFSTGTWNDVCLTYDGTTVSLYGNGALLAQAAKSWNTVDSGGTFIGNDYSNHVWNGNIDMLSYYTRALSATEIANLYASPTQ